MSDAALAVAEAGLIALPEERVIAMIEVCATNIAQARTIPDALQAVTYAQAIEAVTRKINASRRLRKEAMLLCISAERQLGTITRDLPIGKTGRAAQSAPNQTLKREILASHGIRSGRASSAERLANVPASKMRAVVAKASSITEARIALGLASKQAGHPPRAMRTIAMDAVGLLVQCQSQTRPPKAEEVDPLREAFARADATWGAHGSVRS